MRQAGSPETLCRLVAQCTGKAPSKRPRGFAPICAELERILATESADPNAATLVIPERQPPAPAPPFRKLLIWLGVAFLTIAVIATFVLRRDRSPQPSAPAPAARITPPSGEMVLLPGGLFLFGENKEQVSLPAFYIDRTEVTNAAYLAFGTPRITRYRPISLRTARGIRLST